MANLIRLMLGKVNTAAYTHKRSAHRLFPGRAHGASGPARGFAHATNIIDRAERVKRAMPLKYLIIDPYLFMEMETGRYNTGDAGYQGHADADAGVGA